MHAASVGTGLGLGGGFGGSGIASTSSLLAPSLAPPRAVAPMKQKRAPGSHADRRRTASGMAPSLTAGAHLMTVPTAAAPAAATKSHTAVAAAAAAATSYNHATTAPAWVTQQQQHQHQSKAARTLWIIDTVAYPLPLPRRMCLLRSLKPRAAPPTTPPSIPTTTPSLSPTRRHTLFCVRSPRHCVTKPMYRWSVIARIDPCTGYVFCTPPFSPSPFSYPALFTHPTQLLVRVRFRPRALVFRVGMFAKKDVAREWVVAFHRVHVSCTAYTAPNIPQAAHLVGTNRHHQQQGDEAEFVGMFYQLRQDKLSHVDKHAMDLDIDMYELPVAVLHTQPGRW